MSVVVAYVPDATGLLALNEGAQQARWRGVKLIVVNVIVRAAYTKPTPADEKTLDAVAARLTADGIPFEIRQIDQTLSHSSDEILKVAADTGAELIVVGLKRRSAVAKALLGSNAQRVLLDAHCPVLSVWHADDAQV